MVRGNHKIYTKPLLHQSYPTRYTKELAIATLWYPRASLRVSHAIEIEPL